MMAEKVSRRRFIKTASATAAGVYGLSKAGSEGIAKAAPPVGSAAPPPPVQPRVPLARRPNFEDHQEVWATSEGNPRLHGRGRRCRAHRGGRLSDPFTAGLGESVHPGRCGARSLDEAAARNLLGHHALPSVGVSEVA